MKLNKHRKTFCEFVAPNDSPRESVLKITWFEHTKGQGIYEYWDENGEVTGFELSTILQPLFQKNLQQRFLPFDRRCEIFDVFKAIIQDYLYEYVNPAEFKLLMAVSIDDYMKTMKSAIVFKSYCSQIELK